MGEAVRVLGEQRLVFAVTFFHVLIPLHKTEQERSTGEGESAESAKLVDN